MKLQLSKWKSNLKCWKSYSHTLDAWIKGLSLDLLPLWCHNLDDEPKLELWLVTYITPQIKIVHHLTCLYNRAFFNIFSFLNQIEQFFVSLDVEIGGLQLYFECQKYKNNVENIVCFKFFEGIVIDFFFTFNTISSSFLIYFEWFTTW